MIGKNIEPKVVTNPPLIRKFTSFRRDIVCVFDEFSAAEVARLSVVPLKTLSFLHYFLFIAAGCGPGKRLQISVQIHHILATQLRPAQAFFLDLFFHQRRMIPHRGNHC